MESMEALKQRLSALKANAAADGGLDTAPRPLRLMVCACLDRPWSLLPAEPRVRPLVGHFRLAPKGT